MKMENENKKRWIHQRAIQLDSEFENVPPADARREMALRIAELEAMKTPGINGDKPGG